MTRLHRRAGRRVGAHRRPVTRLVLVLAAAALVVAGGCDDDDDSPNCPVSGIQLESIYLTADSVATGAEVGLWALPEVAGQEYAWSASAGEFSTVIGNYAVWKAPDNPALARLMVVATNSEMESKALAATIAVATYLPRHTPAYTGASYCGLECHGVLGHGANYDRWVATAHAITFPAVEAHPAYAPELCARCHTVGFGDRDADGRDRHNGGYDEVAVTRLEGVQCESCHGPVSDRHGTILPEHAALAMRDSLYAPGRAGGVHGCGSCHESYGSSAHAQGHAYVSEWTASAHAAIPAGVDLNDWSCIRCHTARGFIALLDDRPIALPADPQPVTCVACHDPHGSDFAADLRRDPSVDVCSQCHSDRFGGFPREPHAPQAEMLAGTGGYQGFFPGPAASTPHANVLRRGCVECHFPAGAAAASHSFVADPASCAACHPGAGQNDFAWAAARRDEVLALMGTLEGELRAASAEDSATSAFAAARFNLDFVRTDGSTGAHNYAYAKQLLETSIAGFEPGGRER